VFSFGSGPVRKAALTGAAGSAGSRPGVEGGAFKKAKLYSEWIDENNCKTTYDNDGAR
jgi:hypothetical protein